MTTMVAAARSRRLWYGLRLAAATLLLMLAARTLHLERVLALLATIDLWTLLAVLGLFGLGQVLSACRWRLALSQMMPAPPALAALFRLCLLGMFWNIFMPSIVGGDVARAELLRRAAGGGNAYASVLVDRMLGLLAVVCLGTAALGLALHTGAIAPMDAGGALVLLASMIVFVTGAFLFGRRLPRFRHPALRRFVPLRDALARFLHRPLVPLLSFGLALAVQLLGSVVPVGLLAQALGIEVAWSAHLVIVPLITLATLLPVSINGLGVRESGYVLLYGQLGVGADAAFALGFAWSLVLTAFGLLGGLGLLVRDPRLQRRALLERSI